MKAAFREVLGQAKIGNLEANLQKTQGVISLHISSIISKQICSLQKAVDKVVAQNRSLGFSGESRTQGLNQSLERLHLDYVKVIAEATMPDSTQVEDWKEHLAQLFVESKEVSREKAILTSLNFESRPKRHGWIPVAYQKTFEWIFNGHFGTWLEHGSGIFWISGKAGSGKSTLMKFVANHPRTQEALGRWAAPLPYATGAHYFWNSGTSLQKSHKGLLQTLLYDIFRQYPSTMQFSVQHQRWDLAHSHHEQASAEPWAIPELTETLQRLTVQQSLPMRICLFVDGLDEFEGETVDMEELCEILEALAQSPYVKLVVSSRPWNVFEHHFGQDELKKLYTHHLTEQDILTFATARLESHPRWKATLTTTTANSPHQGTPSYLISRICERACGVFLWVRLVTQSLRNGLTNNDTMNDLERRLDSLPADLERLFEHIIKQIDPFYHQLSAEYLLLASNAPEPLKVEAFHFYNQELKDGPGYALDCPVAYRNWRIWGYDVLCNINAYSGGLLEAPDGVTVQFLHRTVHDFLQTQNTSNLLKSKIRPGFDVFASLARAYLVSVKTLQKKIPSLDEEGNIKITGKRPYEYEGEVCSALRGALLAVSKTQPHQQGDGRLLLDELEWAFTTNSFSVTTFGVDADDRDMDMDLFCIFRDHLVRYNLAWYLELKLAESKTLDYFKPFKRIGYSPLFAALDNSVEVVDLLLQYGEDINICKETDSFSSKALSPWTHFCHHVFRETRPRLSTRVVGMMQSLLRQSPNTSEIMNPRDNKPKRVTIFTAFLEWMWENAVDEWSLVMLQKALGSFLDAGAEFGTQELRVMFGDLRGDTVLKKERERRAYMEMVKYVIDKCKSRDDILIEIKRRMPRRLPSHRSQPLITLIDAHLAALSDRKSTERGRDGDVEMIESTEE